MTTLMVVSEAPRTPYISALILAASCQKGCRLLPPEKAIWKASLVSQLVKNLLQCGRPGFDPWVGKIPWRRERLPTPVFWPGEFHGLYSPWGHKESDTTERLSLHFKQQLGFWGFPRTQHGEHRDFNKHPWVWLGSFCEAPVINLVLFGLLINFQ